MVKLEYSFMRRAFSLVEVLTATIVMTMMMVAVIAYIQYGSMIWQKGHSKVSADNYIRMAFDMVKHDLLKANLIAVPAASTTSTIASGTLRYMLPDITAATLTISVDPTTKTLNRAIIGVTTAAIGAQYNNRFARNVELFRVERLSSWTVRISLQIRSDMEASEDVSGPAGIPDGEVNFYDREIISSESIVLIAPGAGG